MFSETSANSRDFKARAVGAFYSKKFQIDTKRTNSPCVLVVGSVIGLDTKLAKEMKQNSIANIYSSPAEVYFNGNKIGELHINGDNQEIEIPSEILKATNEVTIKAGRNLFQYAYVDYDDIEITNLRLEFKNRAYFANSPSE